MSVKTSQRTAGIKRFSAAPAQSSTGCQFGSSFASKHIQSCSFVTFSSARFSGSSSRLNQRLSVVSRFSRKLPPVLKDGGAGIDLRRLIAGLTAEEVSCLFHGDIRLAGDHFRRDLPQAGVAFEVVGVLSVGKARLRQRLNFHGPIDPAVTFVHTLSPFTHCPSTCPIGSRKIRFA